MQAPEKVEEFGAQWILTKDPRSEITPRACAACGSNEAQPLGKKHGLAMMSCRKCSTVYTPYSPWYSSEIYYDTYYKDESLSPPAFVQTRMEEITAEFLRLPENEPAARRWLWRGKSFAGGAKERLGCAGRSTSRQTQSSMFVNWVLKCFTANFAKANFPSQHFDVDHCRRDFGTPAPSRGCFCRKLRVCFVPVDSFGQPLHMRVVCRRRVLGIKWRCVWPPEHLQLFSVAGLKALLREVRFQRACESGRPAVTRSRFFMRWAQRRTLRKPLTSISIE